MKIKNLPRFLLCLVLLASGVSGALAQGTASRVTGTVVDPSGAVVPDATVTLTNEGTQVSFTTQTTSTGNYVFDSVQIGTYTVSVEKTGFKKFISTTNPVNVNQPATVDVTLEVGGVADVVQVVGSAELVQTGSSGNFGNTVEQRTLEALPIVGVRGRNPLALINLQPGVVSGANTGGGVHVHGSRDRAFNFTLDGIDINESSAGGSNFTPLRPNPDSISEFQVVTSNFTAELGRSSGAQVTLVTRSGTNDFHGNLFEFYQTPRFIANEYNNNLNGTPRGQFVQHIFGGTLGGPIIRNKTFFFTNLQLLRTSQSIARTRTVLTQQARQGIFRYVANGRNNPAGVSGATVDAAGNPLLPACPATILTTTPACIANYSVVANDPFNFGLDPTVQQLINLTPLPNSFAAGGDGLNFAGFNFLAPQNERQYDLAFKIDHTFNERNTMYVRYAQGEQNTLGDAGNGNTNGGIIGGAGGPRAFPDSPRNIDTLRNPKNLAVNYRWTASPRLTNEVVVGFNRFTFSFNNADENADLNSPLRFDCPFAGNTTGCLDLTNPIDNTPTINNARSLRTYQFVDNLSWLRDAHTFKFGTNLRYQQHLDNRGQAAGFYINPQVDFSRVANPAPSNVNTSPTGINTANDRPRLQSFYNVMLGRIGNVGQGFVAASDTAFGPAGSRFPFDARYPEYDFYAQDTWKMRPNLTFDFGLRYEIKISPKSAGELPILRPDRPLRVGEAPANNVRFVEGKLFDSDWNNFAPTVGVAWDPFGDGKTSVRGNFRLAYDRMNTFVFSSFIYNAAPGATFGAINSTAGSLPNEQGRLRFGIPVPAPPAGVTPEALRQLAPFGSSATTTVIDPSLRSPKTYQWGASFQREVGWGSVVEVNYIGRKGVGLYGGYDVNQVDIFRNGFLEGFNAVRTAFLASPNCFPNFNSALCAASIPANASPLLNNLLASDTRRGALTGSQYFASLAVFTADLNLGSVATAADTLARRSNLNDASTPTIVRSGFSPFFFRPYPQFSGAVNVIDSNDFSVYNGLELQLARRYSRGLSYQVAYTLSKSMDTRSFDPALTVLGRGTTQLASNTPYNVQNRRLNYARSDFDRRHALQGYLVYDIPLGNGRRFLRDVNPVIDRIIGGFQLSSAFILQSGRPFTVYSGANTISNVLQTPANCNGCSPDLGSVRQESGTNFFFTQEERALFSAPAPGEFGNTGRNYFTGPKSFNLDLMLGKKIYFTESTNLELRAEMQNATNTPAFDFPTAVVTNSTFGRIRGSVVNTARRVQLAVKFNF